MTHPIAERGELIEIRVRFAEGTSQVIQAIPCSDDAGLAVHYWPELGWCIVHVRSGCWVLAGFKSAAAALIAAGELAVLLPGGWDRSGTELDVYTEAVLPVHLLEHSRSIFKLPIGTVPASTAHLADLNVQR